MCGQVLQFVRGVLQDAVQEQRRERQAAKQAGRMGASASEDAEEGQGESACPPCTMLSACPDDWALGHCVCVCSDFRPCAVPQCDQSTCLFLDVSLSGSHEAVASLCEGPLHCLLWAPWL